MHIYDRAPFFGRAALELFEASEGEVLLLAVVEGLRDVLNEPRVDRGGGGSNDDNGGKRTPVDISSVHASLDRTDATGKGGGEIYGSARGVRRAVGEGGGGVAENRGSAAAFVHATIFPGEGFIFNGTCNVLVLAEDKTNAERHLVELQVCVTAVCSGGMNE